MSGKGKRINVYVESEKIDLIYKFQEKVKENGRASSSKVIVEFMEDYINGS
jgi:hypothetical protein